MATYKQGSSQDLLQTLSSYLGFPTHGAARALQQLLTQRREVLLNPLSKKAKSAEDRKKVTSKELELGGGTKRAFGDDFVERVKSLSDALDLNEIVCSELLLKAESSKARYGRASQLEIAESIFFEARQATLKTLQMLFTARQNAHHAGDTGILISQFTTELLDGGLFHTLLNTIKENLNIEERESASLNPPRTATSTSAAAPLTVCVAQWDHQRTERHMVAEIVFTICYTTTISPDQAKKLLELIQALAIKAASLNADILQHNGLYQTCYTLIAAMVVLLDVCNEHDLMDVRGDKTRSRLPYDTAFIKEFDAILQQPQWQHAVMPLNPSTDPTASLKDLKASNPKISTSTIPSPNTTPRFIAAQQTIKLAWASFLRQTIRLRRNDTTLGPAQDLFRESNIDNLLSNLSPTFLYLAAVVKSELFENDTNFKASYVEVFDELVRGFLTTSSLKAKEMKREEENGLREEAAYRQYPIGPKPPKTIRNFDHFLQLISALYQGQPALAARYWSEEYQTLLHFVRGAGDNLFESNFVSYLKMLSALSSGEECAQHTFHFLQESSRKYTNWDYFFDALHNYYMDLQQPISEETGYYDYSGRASGAAPSRMTRQISPEEVESLEAILDVSQSVLRYSPAVRASMLTNPDWRVLDALFHLLTCPIPMSLKASLTRTITQFARDPSAQVFIWQYMDAANLLGASTSPGFSKDSSKSGSKGGASSTTTVDAAGIVSGGGIIFELSEIESKEEQYPYTLAFVELLNALLTNHYHESRDTLADVNLWPYIQFLIKDVFQRFDQRAYANPNEKWHIARASLKVFLSLLRDSVDAFSFSEQTFSVSQYASLAPGGKASNTGADTSSSSTSAAQAALARYGASTLKLYRYFLSRTELLKKVIAIVCGDGQANLLIATRSQSKDSALEDCVRYSLMIFETVLLRQGPILSSPLSSLNDEYGISTSSNGSSSSSTATPTVRRLRLAEENTSILVPLHTILLRKMSDLAALALYVNYPYNTTIARLSVSIVHLLSRDTDKLALILHDQEVATDFVNGYIDKLETDDLPSRNQDQVHYRGTDSSTGISLVAESNPYVDPSEMDDDSAYWASRAPSIREAILSLLLECATQPEYNLTQLLFGMNPSDSSRIGHHSSYSFNRHLERATGATTDSAALSVLPTILRLLGERTLSTAQPKLASLMYELLYTLLKRPNEFGGVGRSLRSSEFFRRQFAILDVSLNSASVANQIIFSSEQRSLLLPSQLQAVSEGDQAYVLQQLEQELYGPLMEQRAWLLKSVALELHTTCGTNRTYATHLLDVLYTTQFSGDAGLASGLRPSSVETSGRKRLTSGTHHQHTQDANGLWQDAPLQQQRMKMRELLDALEIPLIEPLPIVQGSVYFGRHAGPVDVAGTGVELARCTEVDSRGFSAVDLRLLYGQLVASQERIRADYTLSQEQSADMISEETVILRRAVAWNRFQQVLMSQCRILEAWREVLEVSLIECYHLLDANSKETVLYELLETLLSRLNHPELRLQVGQPLTSCILMLTAKLRQLTYPIHVAKLRSLEDSFAIEGSSLSSSTSANDPSSGTNGKHVHKPNGDHSTGPGPNRHSEITEEILATAAPNYLPVEQLLVIQKGLTAALLRQGTTLNIRGNLYAALLNYLQFTQRSSAEVILLASNNTFGDFWASDEDSAGVSLPQQQHQQRQLYLGTLRQLHAVSERLMEVIATDASDAPHLFRSIAFAMLDALCTYECSMYAGSSVPSSSVGVKWLSHLTRQGLLRYFLESLVQYDDGALSDVLLPTADSLNDLYVFESKMTMLLSMASTPSGAASLVESGLLQVLTKFTCIDHPHQPFVGGDARMDTLQESWMRPVHERYEQILLPSLRVLVAVMTQMPRNTDVAAQAIDFIESHSELVSILLKDRGPAPSKASLQLLCLVSSIFYHLAPHDSLLSTRLQVQASKFHHLLVQLLAKYVDTLSEVSRYNPYSKKASIDGDQEEEPLRAELLSLLRNLTGLVRRLSVGATPQTTSNLEAALAKPGKIQFAPSVTGAVSATPSKSKAYGSSSATPAASAATAQRSSQRDQPPLTVLIMCLSGALTQLGSIKEESLATIKKLQSVHQCKSDELLAIIRNASSSGSGIFGLDTDVDSLTVEKSTTFQLQQAVQHILGVRIAEQRFRTSTLYQIIENAMFVLWRHMSFYLADEETGKDSTSLFLNSSSSRSAKFDKATLQRETSSSLGPLYSRLEQLSPLSHHQTHIIPSLVRRLKDVLGDN